MKMIKATAIAFSVLMAGQLAYASPVLVTFDDQPQGPSFFGSPAQTINYSGVASFSGGTLLGLASNFPAIVYASSPNVYGTYYGGPYSNTLTITVDPTATVNEVSFALFNGETYADSFTVNAYTNATLDQSVLFSNVPSNFGNGYVLPDLLDANITKVTITTSDPSYDFLIDDVAFNESVQTAVNGSPVPEPSSLLMLGSGMLSVAGAAFRRMRRA